MEGTYIDFVTQHRSFLRSEVLPSYPSCRKLYLEVFGYLNVETIHCDGATGIVGVVHSSCIFKASLDEQRGILGKRSWNEA
jgi:hypothetical protein